MQNLFDNTFSNGIASSWKTAITEADNDYNYDLLEAFEKTNSSVFKEQTIGLKAKTTEETLPSILKDKKNVRFYQYVDLKSKCKYQASTWLRIRTDDATGEQGPSGQCHFKVSITFGNSREFYWDYFPSNATYLITSKAHMRDSDSQVPIKIMIEPIDNLNNITAVYISHPQLYIAGKEVDSSGYWDDKAVWGCYQTINLKPNTEYCLSVDACRSNPQQTDILPALDQERRFQIGVQDASDIEINESYGSTDGTKDVNEYSNRGYPFKDGETSLSIKDKGKVLNFTTSNFSSHSKKFRVFFRSILKTIEPNQKYIINEGKIEITQNDSENAKNITGWVKLLDSKIYNNSTIEDRDKEANAMPRFTIEGIQLREGSAKQGYKPSPNDILMKGYGYVIERSSEDSNYLVWDDIYKVIFNQNNYIFPNSIFEDYDIQQGKKYQYAISLYQSDGTRNVRLKSPIITADFEDMFLYDGHRQLKIAYNPKVSSFKNNILESKIDTIGSQYPYFFRNGNVLYKDFSISGFISYFSDENELFMSNAELGLIDLDNGRAHNISNEQLSRHRTTNLVSHNFTGERLFKMKVLEWLNNGKPKLFKSPAEGNYIVRLMNCSLSPNDTLGRMLHTFNSNAYEIADYNRDNLIIYNLIPFYQQVHSDNNYSLICLRQNLTSIDNEKNYRSLKYGGIYKLVLQDTIPGTTLRIKYKNSPQIYYHTVKGYDDYIVGIYDSPIVSLQAIPPEGDNSLNTSDVLIYFYNNTSPQNFIIPERGAIEDELVSI